MLTNFISALTTVVGGGTDHLQMQRMVLTKIIIIMKMNGPRHNSGDNGMHQYQIHNYSSTVKKSLAERVAHSDDVRRQRYR